MTYYEVGDVIRFVDHDSETIVAATVVARVDNIRDGLPGFIGLTCDAPPRRTWGVDQEMKAILRRAELSGDGERPG